MRILQRLGILAFTCAAFLTPIVAAADQADDQYAVAAGMYARHEWRLAIGEFERFLRDYPQHAQANQSVFFLAEALLEMRQFDAATARYREYLDREPAGAFARSALFRAGESCYLAGQHATAQADLERFRAGYPDDALNAYVLLYLGEIALADGNAALAIEHFEAALRSSPEGKRSDDCRLGLARAREKLGQTEEARRLYLALAAKTGGAWAAEAQFHLAALEYGAHNYAEAEHAFEEFEAQFPQDPHQPNARLGRGWALFKLERFAEARTVFAGLVNDPQLEPIAGFWLGLTQTSLGDYAAAADTLLTAAQARPNDKLVPAIRFRAGDALLRAGKCAEAVREFDHVLTLADVDQQWLDHAARGKVQAALHAKDYVALDRGVAEFEKRFPQSPLKDDVRRMRARSLIERTQFAAAAAILEPLVAAHPTSAEATDDYYLAALAYEGLKRYPEALAAIAPVAEHAHGSAKLDAQLAHGTILMGLRRYVEAIAPLESLLAGKPSGDCLVRGQAALAVCYARSGRMSDARRVYAELSAGKPPAALLTAVTEQLSEAAYEAGDSDWAGELFRRLAVQSNSPEHELQGLSGQAWSHFKAHRLSEAAALFEQLLNKNPPAALGAEAALARGQILEQLGRPDPALLMYELVVERYAKSTQYASALLACARLRSKLQQYPQAIADFQKFAEQFPQYPQIDTVLYEWYWTLEDSGKKADAAQVLQRLYKEHRPSRHWADVTYRLALGALAAKDYDRAQSLTAEVLAAKPETQIRAHAMYLQGQVAAGREDWAAVRQAMKSFLSDFPQSDLRLPADYWLAEALYRQGDYDAAGQRLERLVQQLDQVHDVDKPREPWQAMILLRRAQVSAHERKWAEAQQLAAQIEKRYPGFAEQYEADYLIGRCRASQADFDGARRAYQRVIESSAGAKTETAAMAQWMIGESYFHQKNYDAAIREYLRVEILYAYPTWQAGALLQAGKCHELLGQWPEAQRVYERLINSYPKTPFSDDGRRRLQAARERLQSQAAR